MGGIFVSYRRSDSEGEAGRLFDDLVPIFGEHTVFMDVSAIEAGRDFRRAIEAGVTKCGVLLAMIGPEWLNAKDESGASRLNNPGDFVRIETASALKRDIPVIPVLVRGAKMPSADQLPEDLKELAYRNCVELTHARWRSDMQLLVDALHRLLDDTSQATAPTASLQTTTSRGVGEKLEGQSPVSIDPSALQRVSRELGLYIGQIADIVVRRTAPRCTSVEDLYLKVAEEIDSPDEREKFLRNRAPIAAPPLLDAARTSRQQNRAAENLEIPPLAEEIEPVTPTQSPAEKSALDRRKYMFLAGGSGILILLLVLGSRFALRGSRPTVQPPPPEVHVAESAPAKVDTPSPPAEPGAGIHEPVPAAATRAQANSQPAPPPRVPLSEEVSRDLLLTKVVPVYPPLARQAHIQGVVVLNADISREGTIENLRAASGHPLLLPAAVEAAKQFRYKPYVLNGKPVAVSIQIVIKFTLSGG